MTKDISLQQIIARRTIRQFDQRAISRETIDELIEAARWAPSGINNQPWRFVTIESRQTLDKIAEFTKYAKILRNAPAAVAVFIDTSRIYHREKDIQSIGAAIENLLLAAHLKGLGACWLGEILNRREEVEAALQVADALELMAVVALGHPKEDVALAERKRAGPDEIIVGRF